MRRGLCRGGLNSVCADVAKDGGVDSAREALSDANTGVCPNPVVVNRLVSVKLGKSDQYLDIGGIFLAEHTMKE